MGRAAPGRGVGSPTDVMKVYTTFIHSASITRGVTYAKLTHTVAEGRYTTAPYLFPAF